jgi:ribonuclease HI
MTKALTMQFDGGSRGNPGPAGYGVIILADEVPIVTIGDFIGTATNNVAEYRGMIRGMEEALKLGCTELLVRGDSELVIKQMKGQYKVRNPGLKPLFDQADALRKKFARIAFDHTYRDGNDLADKLANKAMSAKKEVTEL